MGQYHKVVNLDKQEYLTPSSFDDGAKLMEFGTSAKGTMTALAILLSDSPDRGGGDPHTRDREWYGRWAGDRVMIAGDYADGDEGKPNVYDQASSGEGDWLDISTPVASMIRKVEPDMRMQTQM
jgi:hypothetical protein